jgi:hypothetical protein
MRIVAPLTLEDEIYQMYDLDFHGSVTLDSHILWDFRFSRRRVWSLVFWDVAPCSLLGVDRRFRGSYCLHYQWNESSPWRWRQFTPLKRRSTRRRLHSATSQKTLKFSDLLCCVSCCLLFECQRFERTRHPNSNPDDVGKTFFRSAGIQPEDYRLHRPEGQYLSLSLLFTNIMKILMDFEPKVLKGFYVCISVHRVQWTTWVINALTNV